MSEVLVYGTVLKILQYSVKWFEVHTDTRQALLSKAHQHIETQVAISWFAKVFEPPHVVTIFFQILCKKIHMYSKVYAHQLYLYCLIYSHTNIFLGKESSKVKICILWQDMMCSDLVIVFLFSFWEKQHKLVKLVANDLHQPSHTYRTNCLMHCYQRGKLYQNQKIACKMR